MFPSDPLVLRLWEQKPTDHRTIESALLREDDYVERSFVGNYDSVPALGQNSQTNPPILVGDQRVQQLVSGV
jgi:hypothetical protein